MNDDNDDKHPAFRVSRQFKINIAIGLGLIAALIIYFW